MGAKGDGVSVGEEEDLFKELGQILSDQHNNPPCHGAVIFVNGGQVFVCTWVWCLYHVLLILSVGGPGAVFGTPCYKHLEPWEG